jgi:predicted phage terminase large subunit-like protein
VKPFRLTEAQEKARDLIAGPQKHTLLYGGSRSGKTFEICYVTATRSLMAPGSRHVIFRKHGVTVKQSVGLDTFPKMMRLAYPGVAFKLYEQDGLITLPEDAEVWLAGLDDKERVDKVLGKEFATLAFNEASEIPFQSYMVGQTRLAQNVMRRDGKPLKLRSLVDLNPTVTAHWTYQLFVLGRYPDGTLIDKSDYRWMVMNPGDNAENLPEGYIESLKAQPAALRKRFYEGTYGADEPNALWRRKDITYGEAPADLVRVVVAIDPAATSEDSSDETGIVAAGMSQDKRGYVLADQSGRWRPEEWARKAIALYHTLKADCIVAEVNNGGEMVGAVIRAQAPNVPFRAVHASRGKVTRAEPVSALYELGQVTHAEEFVELETQMCSFTSDFDRKAKGYSPDRVDALVWAMSDLFPGLTAPKAADTPLIIPPRVGLGSQRSF